jgi:hypothetical protein
MDKTAGASTGKKNIKKDAVISHSIWRLVFETTQSKAPYDALKKYLQHSRYRDIGLYYVLYYVEKR